VGVEGIGGGFLRFSAGAVVLGREGSIRCDGIGLPTSTAYWRASREEGWVLLQIRPVQMARMTGKVGVVFEVLGAAGHTAGEASSCVGV
jgi:hypothetical protein